VKTRPVQVRLRPSTTHALRELAAERWETIADLVSTALATCLRVETPVRLGRVPMPAGDDVVVPMSPEHWLAAKKFADRADITIGQLCRLAAESYVREWPAMRRAAS
jgi:hypothetical protein